MKTDFWLKITGVKKSYGWGLSIPKASAGKPACGRSEVAIKVTLDIPESYFDLPEMRAKISLPDVRSSNPISEVVMQERIAEQLKESLGVQVTFIADDQVGE